MKTPAYITSHYITCDSSQFQLKSRTIILANPELSPFKWWSVWPEGWGLPRPCYLPSTECVHRLCLRTVSTDCVYRLYLRTVVCVYRLCLQTVSVSTDCVHGLSDTILTYRVFQTRQLLPSPRSPRRRNRANRRERELLLKMWIMWRRRRRLNRR